MSRSVNHFPLDDFVGHLEMRDLERPHRLDRECQDLIGTALCVRLTQPPSCETKGAQHLSAIEALPLTVVTEAHDDVDSSTGSIRGCLYGSSFGFVRANLSAAADACRGARRGVTARGWSRGSLLGSENLNRIQ